MKPWSHRRLFLIFVGALLIFLPLRWNPEPWLQAKSQELMQQLPFAITIGQQDVSWRGILLQDVTLQLPAPAKPLHLSQLEASPAWLLCLQGQAALRIRLQGEELQGALSLALSDGYAQVSGMDLRAALPWLQSQWQQAMLLELSGDILLQGDARVFTGNEQTPPQPISAALTADWIDAAVKLGATPSALGKYTLKLEGSTADAWQWHLAGGQLLELNGEGSLQTQGGSWLQWPLQGRLEMKNAPGSPLTAMLGAQRQIAVSGTIQAPFWSM